MQSHVPTAWDMPGQSAWRTLTEPGCPQLCWSIVIPEISQLVNRKCLLWARSLEGLSPWSLWVPCFVPVVRGHILVEATMEQSHAPHLMAGKQKDRGRDWVLEVPLKTHP